MAVKTKKNNKPRVSASTRCPLLKMGRPVKCNDGWIAVNAIISQMFMITQEHIDNGIPRDPVRCVIGLALHAGFGDHYRFEVGAGIIKIIDEDAKVFVRFSTPPALRAQINKWERRKRGSTKFGTWDLPPGPQVMGALPPSWIRMYEGKDRRKTPTTTVTVLVSRKSTGAFKRKTVVVGGHTIKHRASPTRIVRRVAAILSSTRSKKVS